MQLTDSTKGDRVDVLVEGESAGLYEDEKTQTLDPEGRWYNFGHI